MTYRRALDGLRKHKRAWWDLRRQLKRGGRSRLKLERIFGVLKLKGHFGSGGTSGLVAINAVEDDLSH